MQSRPNHRFLGPAALTCGICKKEVQAARDRPVGQMCFSPCSATLVPGLSPWTAEAPWHPQFSLQLVLLFRGPAGWLKTPLWSTCGRIQVHLLVNPSASKIPPNGLMAGDTPPQGWLTHIDTARDEFLPQGFAPSMNLHLVSILSPESD